MFFSLLGARLESFSTAADDGDDGKDISAFGTEGIERDAAFSAEGVASAVTDDAAIAVSKKCCNFSSRFCSRVFKRSFSLACFTDSVICLANSVLTNSVSE